MIELLCAVILGIILGYVAAPRDRDFKDQRKIYEDKLQEQFGLIEYYKKWVKVISEENAEFRRKQ